MQKYLRSSGSNPKYIHNSNTNVQLAQFSYEDKQEIKKKWRSVYATLASEEERLDHLGYRHDLMCRQIVVKRNKA